eukprot:8116529-Pyramimonas_sp.AAC.2
MHWILRWSFIPVDLKETRHQSPGNQIADASLRTAEKEWVLGRSAIIVGVHPKFHPSRTSMTLSCMALPRRRLPDEPAGAAISALAGAAAGLLSATGSGRSPVPSSSAPSSTMSGSP